jgi:hypothetical protein
MQSKIAINIHFYRVSRKWLQMLEERGIMTAYKFTPAEDGWGRIGE